MVRQGISIGLLIIHLGIFTDLHEVLRLPILFGHFVEHRSQVPSMTFFQFLSMHYKTDTPHDATDMELPFKDCSGSIATAVALLEQKVILTTMTGFAESTFPSTYVAFIPSSGLDEIFQPPRA